VQARFGLEPCVPREHRNYESRCERHVHRSRVRVANNSRRARQHQGCIDRTKRTEPLQKPINREDQHGCVKDRRQSRGPVTYAKYRVRDHRLPVIKRRFLQPRSSAQSRRDPIVTCKHFTRDLRIARFISADQTKGRELPKKKERAEGEQEYPVRDAGARGQVSGQWLVDNASNRVCTHCPLTSSH